MQFIENLAKKELGKCYYDFLELQFEMNCVSLFISKGLSYGIVTLGAIFKVPQMIQLLKGSKGFSVNSVYLELIASVLFMGKMMHIAEFIAYGETVFLVIQDLIILLIISLDRKESLLVPTLGALAVYLYCTLIPVDILTILAMGQIPLSVMSKIPQIVENFSNKSTGNLSVVTSLAYLMGSVARVFTSIKQVGDYLVIATFTVSSVLNVILILQLWMYKQPTLKKKKQ